MATTPQAHSAAAVGSIESDAEAPIDCQISDKGFTGHPVAKHRRQTVSPSIVGQTSSPNIVAVYARLAIYGKCKLQPTQDFKKEQDRDGGARDASNSVLG